MKRLLSKIVALVALSFTITNAYAVTTAIVASTSSYATVQEASAACFAHTNPGGATTFQGCSDEINSGNSRYSKQTITYSGSDITYTWYYYNYGGTTTTGTCSNGTQIRAQVDADTSGFPPATTVIDGCTYKLSGVSACLGSSGKCSGNYTADGTSGTVTNPNNVINNADNGCIMDSQGIQQCLSKTDVNCGTLNGKQFCQDQLPITGTGCTLIEAGFVCNAGSTPSTTLPDGTPIPKIGSISKVNPDGSVTNTDLYGSIGAGTAAGTIAGDVTGSTVQIDETGVPSPQVDNSDSQITSTGIDDLLTGIPGQTGLPAPDSSKLPSIPGYQACQTLTFTAAGHTITFPNASQCSKLETFKSMVAWFLYIITAYFMYQIILSTQEKI